MTELDAHAVGVVAVREAKSRGFREPETRAFGWGAKWVAGRLPSRDEIADALEEIVTWNGGPDSVERLEMADAVLALIREHVTKE